MPFPIDEVVWDYQLVGGGPDKQVEVVIVAVKAEYLEAINAAVEESGLRANKIGIATSGLYNAFRYNYSNIPGCSLLVDIGARTTNVVFIEPRKDFLAERSHWRQLDYGRNREGIWRVFRGG